jgi:very-short-patch-repair endonuclease
MRHGLARDAKRTKELESRGYRVLRFWNNDVHGNVEGVMEAIAAALRDAGPPRPIPPRHASHGGRGEEALP